MLQMLEDFINLYEVTRDVLDDIGSEHLLDNLNIDLMKSVVAALKPVEITLNAMSEKMLIFELLTSPLIS